MTEKGFSVPVVGARDRRYSHYKIGAPDAGLIPDRHEERLAPTLRYTSVKGAPEPDDAQREAKPDPKAHDRPEPPRHTRRHSMRQRPAYWVLFAPTAINSRNT